MSPEANDDGPSDQPASEQPTSEQRNEHVVSVIRLDDFLKRSGLVGTGGEAKIRIQSGEVLVNGLVEVRRRKQLFVGDVVELLGERFVVNSDEL
jgi:ribosome-associated protein